MSFGMFPVDHQVNFFHLSRGGILSHPDYQLSPEQRCQSLQLLFLTLFVIISGVALMAGVGGFGGHQGWWRGGHFTDISQTACLCVGGGGILGIALSAFLFVKFCNSLDPKKASPKNLDIKS